MVFAFLISIFILVFACSQFLEGSKYVILTLQLAGFLCLNQVNVKILLQSPSFPKPQPFLEIFTGLNCKK